MKLSRSITFAFCCMTVALMGQDKVGINMPVAPTEKLEIWGYGDQFLRLQSNAFTTNTTGLELVRGTGQNSAVDWRLINGADGLELQQSDDDFASDQTRRMVIGLNGYLGIGSGIPEARLHILNGTNATIEGGGYLSLGYHNATNLVFDNNGILVRSDGIPTTMFIQTEGGATKIGQLQPSDVRVAAGQFVAGSGLSPALFNAGDDDQYTLNVGNTDDGDANRWNISPTASYWAVGGNQLVFAPGNSSTSAALRLYDTNDNDGNTAPVMITSSTHTLLLDGNEIDTKNAPLYINNNSDENILINTNEGNVSIGSTSSYAKVYAYGQGHTLAIQHGIKQWRLTPNIDPGNANNGNLLFENQQNGVVAFASIPGGGSWVAISDSTRKTNITPVQNAMEQIARIKLCRYRLKHAETGGHDIGVIAQELEKVVPEAVSTENGQYGVMYDQLAALAIAGIQEQQKEIDALLAECDLILNGIIKNGSVESWGGR